MLGDKESLLKSVTNYGTVWRKGAGKQCAEIRKAPSTALPITSEFRGRVPEIDARSVPSTP